jgi:stage V sporulation protein R
MTPISHGADWDFDLLERYDTAIAEVAGEFKLDTYPNQIEVITSEQMLDATLRAAADRYPPVVRQEFIRNEQGTAAWGSRVRDRHQLEPVHAYLMEEHGGDAGAVIARTHATANSFFGGNRLFRQ